MHIAVDVQGGDFGPSATVTGAMLAGKRYGVRITLIGDPSAIEPFLSKDGDSRVSVEVLEPEGITENATTDEEMNRHILAQGLRLLKMKKVDAFVSAGDTGEVFLSAVRHTGRMSGVQRPCIAVLLPTANQSVLLLDAGANPDCQPEYMADFALMGSQYAEVCMGRSRPRVYLLSNGTESEKGTALTRAAHVLLNSLDFINYGGCTEPYKLAEEDQIDVLVTDGFNGNVLIKGMETASRMYADALRDAFSASWRSKLGYSLAHSALRSVSSKADPRQYGGAILLGINGIVVIAHGSDDAEAFCSAVRQARDAVNQNVVELVAQAMDPGT